MNTTYIQNIQLEQNYGCILIVIIIIQDKYLKFILSKRDKTQLQTSPQNVCNSFYANVQGKRLCHHSSKATRTLQNPFVNIIFQIIL